MDSANAEDVVEVSVGVGNQLDFDAHFGGHVEDVVGLFSGVDADGFSGAFVADHPAVFLEHTDEEAANLYLVHRGRIIGRVRFADR